MSASTLLRARILVASIRAALINGCRHYDGAGRLLETEREILEVLCAEGGIVVDESGRSARTSVVEQELLLRRDDTSPIASSIVEGRS